MYKFVLAFSSLLLCAFSIAASEAPLNVFVSIPPQKYLVERIGKEHVEVNVLLKPGHAAETFEPAPKQLAALAASEVYFRIGMPFESVWIDLIQQANSELKVVPCCANLPVDTGLDSHVWMSPNNALLLAGEINRQLVLLDPAHQQDYDRNYSELVRDLEQLNTDIKDLLSRPRTAYFIVNHASLGHYARDYGLVQLALEKEGRELGSKSLGQVINKARQEGIRLLLVQKQHQSAGAVAVARELGARQVEIDPLRADYLTNLRYLTSVIAKAVN